MTAVKLTEKVWSNGRKVDQWVAVVNGKALKYVDGFGWNQMRTFLSEGKALEAARQA